MHEEKVKLLAVCDMNGIDSKDVEQLMAEENVPDVDLDNIRLRLGLVEDRKSVV